jgi:D-mannonate dehydratase
MKQRPRRYITQAEMAEIRDRWERGETLNAIARQYVAGRVPFTHFRSIRTSQSRLGLA